MSASDQGVLNAQLNAAIAAQMAEDQRCRPSVLYRPTLRRGWAISIDYIAEYGECRGIGLTPAEAMKDFDKNWNGG